MQRDPVPDAPGSSPLPRPSSLYDILAVILLWNAGCMGRALRAG